MKTAQALQQFEQANGRPWREQIHDYAEAGYAWADVAEIIGVPTTNLKQWCHSRRLSFPWQGHQSPIMRANQSRAIKGLKYGTHSHYRRYTAFGVTASLPKLTERFGHLQNVSYETLRRRVTRLGMDPETALTTPLMSRSERGTYGNQVRRHKQPTHDHPWRIDDERPAQTHTGL